MNQPRCFHYPLYRAMRKYGLENFKCYKIEDTDNVNEREKYWIEFYGTFGKNGYNCTAGGDGRLTIDITDEEIIKAYEELKNIRKVGELFGIDHCTVSNRLKKNGIELKKPGYNSRPVEQFSISGVFIQSFPSISSAAKFITGSEKRNLAAAGNIRRALLDPRGVAYGFQWRDPSTDKEIHPI